MSGAKDFERAWDCYLEAANLLGQEPILGRLKPLPEIQVRTISNPGDDGWVKAKYDERSNHEPT